MPPIPNATVSRLVTYLRVLDQLQKEGATETSSRLLAERAGVSPYQVRKDLTRFGSFGRRGSGYDVNNLEGQLRGILGLTRPWNTVIVGLGRLRSEERRVGKECRARWAEETERRKQ